MEHKKFEKYTAMALETVYSEQEDGNFHTNLIPEVVKHFFTPLNIPKHAYVLDIGCGQGTFLDIMLALDYPNSVGITYSKDDHEACEGKNLSVINCDMSDMLVPDDIVDFIWCRHALEHSPYPLFTLFEFNRVMRQGGKMYIEVPAPDCARRHEDNPNHFSILGEVMWQSLFRKAGFETLSASHFDFELRHEENIIPERYLCFIVEKNATPIQVRTKAAD